MKVSVIVPVYNKSNYLKRCIESILGQTHKDIELILIDDGSTDESLSICNRYKKDKRVVVISQKNRGVSAARNVGIKKVSGDFIMFVDADDYVAKDYVEKMCENISDNDILIAGFSTVENGLVMKNPSYDFEAKAVRMSKILKKKYAKLIAPPYMKLFRKSIVIQNKILFDETMEYGEDTCFVLNYLKDCNSVRIIGYCGYYNCIHNNTLSRKYVPGLWNQYKKIVSALKGIDGINSGILWYWRLRGIKLVVSNNKYLKRNLLKDVLKKTIVYDFVNEIKFLAENRRRKDLVARFNKIKILDDYETVDKIVKNKMSFARFGDGEFRWMLGDDKYVADFQDNNNALADRLKSVLEINDCNLLIGIDIGCQEYRKYVGIDKYFFRRMINNFGEYMLSFLAVDKLYGNAALTRFYMRYKNKNITLMKNKVKNLKRIWNDRDVVCIEGENTKLGVGNDLLDNTRTLKRIIAPSKNAFDKIDEIEKVVIDRVNKKTLVLVSLGPTATIIAADLSKMGYQAIDIGHVDVEYEWYRIGVKHKVPIKGKDVYEVSSNDPVKLDNNSVQRDYKMSIIAKIVRKRL